MAWVLKAYLKLFIVIGEKDRRAAMETVPICAALYKNLKPEDKKYWSKEPRNARDIGVTIIPVGKLIYMYEDNNKLEPLKTLKIPRKKKDMTCPDGA